MFGWSNELIRWHRTCIVLEIDSKATRQSKLGAVYFLHYPPGPPWPCHYLSTLVYVYNKKVHLYDITLQRRPAISVDFGESLIKAAVADPNGHDVYVGTGIGDLCFLRHENRTQHAETRISKLQKSRLMF